MSTMVRSCGHSVVIVNHFGELTSSTLGNSMSWTNYSVEKSEFKMNVKLNS